MCGKDGTQRGVYKLKGEHERGIGTEKEKRTRDVNKREEMEKRKKELY